MSGLVDRAVNRTAHPGALPASDSALRIHADGPIVDLLVGSALFRHTFLASGGQIENTQSAMVLEKLINKLFASIASKDTDSPEDKK